MVTGGSRGIGKAIARQLAMEGADVVIAARESTALNATAAELSAASGRRVIAAVADTGDDDSVVALAERARGELGGIDILINNAARRGGRGPRSDLSGFRVDDLAQEINVKVAGYLRCAQAVAPTMVANGWGRIVNMGGLAARQAGSIVGSVRNVAVAALTKNLADELGPHGVNVTVVHPGPTRTEEDTEPASLVVPTTLGRSIDAVEVAWVVTFLASPKSVAINGDAIACGGGAPGSIHY